MLFVGVVGVAYKTTGSNTNQGDAVCWCGWCCLLSSLVLLAVVGVACCRCCLLLWLVLLAVVLLLIVLLRQGCLLSCCSNQLPSLILWTARHASLCASSPRHVCPRTSACLRGECDLDMHVCIKQLRDARDACMQQSLKQ